MLAFTKDDMRKENQKNEKAARLRDHKMQNWNAHVEVAERYFLSIVQKAKDEQFFESLYVQRDDANMQIQLFAGKHPIGTVEIETDSLGREIGRRLNFEHGAALVISQSALGSVAIIFYPYKSGEINQTQQYVIWKVFDDPTVITEKLLAKATKDFLCYIRVSSVLFAESWCDRARIWYIEARSKKYIGDGGFAKIIFSSWCLPTIGFIGSVASIYSLFRK